MPVFRKSVGVSQSTRAVALTCSFPIDAEHLIREFHGYKREHVRTAAAEDHVLDSLRYAVMGIDRADHLRPRSRERDWRNGTGVYRLG